MLLGALQEAWVTRCVRATQRKRGKSSRWLSDASFMNGSPNNEKPLLSSSNIQHGKQERRIPKKGFPPCVGHCAGRELESKLESKSTEWHQHYICPLTRSSILIFAKPSVKLPSFTFGGLKGASHMLPLYSLLPFVMSTVCSLNHISFLAPTSSLLQSGWNVLCSHVCIFYGGRGSSHTATLKKHTQSDKTRAN